MLYVSVEAREKASDYAKKKALPYTVLVDEDLSVARPIGVDSIPSHFILDRAGKVRYRHVGMIEGYEKVLDELIGKTPEGKKRS